MKRLIPYVIAFACATHSMHASDQKPTRRTTFLQEWGMYKEAGPDQPLSIIAENDMISKARRTRHQSHHHCKRLGYSQAKVLGTYTIKTSDLNGVTLGIGFAENRLHITGKSPIEQKHFHNMLFNIGGFTKAIEKWRWDASVELQTNTDHFALSRYTFFTGLLSGKYSWQDNKNLYAGLIGTTGLRYTRVLPIVGFDYQTAGKWHFNAIFPLNISAVYLLNTAWTVDVGMRSFLSRQRLGEHDKLRRGFVTYRNWGVEAGINYKCNEHLNINLYAGEAFNGRLRLSHHNNRDREHVQFKPSAYCGLLARINF